MPVGNLRTAANNDQDDDPRALRPIPIATKDMVSFVEKNNNAAGQNAEVVVCFLMFSPTSRFDRLSNDDDERERTSSGFALLFVFPRKE